MAEEISRLQPRQDKHSIIGRRVRRRLQLVVYVAAVRRTSLPQEASGIGDVACRGARSDKSGRTHGIRAERWTGSASGSTAKKTPTPPKLTSTPGGTSYINCRSRTTRA